MIWENDVVGYVQNLALNSGWSKTIENWKKSKEKKEIIIFMANLSLVYVIRDQILNRDLLVTSRGPSKVTAENRFNAATQYYGSSASSSLLWWWSSELHPPSSVQKLNLPHTWAYILSNTGW